MAWDDRQGKQAFISEDQLDSLYKRILDLEADASRDLTLLAEYAHRITELEARLAKYEALRVAAKEEKEIHCEELLRGNAYIEDGKPVCGCNLCSALAAIEKESL